MSAIIKDQFKLSTMNNFINLATTNSLYLALARSQAWDTVTGADDIIPLPENNVSFNNKDAEDLLSMKKLNATNMTAGIFRENWVSNVKYDAYRHDWNGSRTSVYTGANAYVTSPTSISDVKCVVVTANYNVYMCIKQPIINGEVQPSLYSPQTGVAVGTNTGIIKTTDGYYWKFMSSTSTDDFVKFSSKYYHPLITVPSAPLEGDPYYAQWVNQGYSANFKGGIYTINVTSGGTGYNSGVAGTHSVTDSETDTHFRVIGDGIGLQCNVVYSNSGTIVDVEVTSPGTGYTYATVEAIGGGGAAFDVIFTSMSGLGVDPKRDVVARYLLVGMSLTGDEGGDFNITNDFRKIILMQDPLVYGSSTVATSTTLNACQTLFVATGLPVGAYPVDAVVTGSISGAKGRVVDFVSSTGAIRILRTSSENSGILGANNAFQVGDTLTSVPGTGSQSILSITNPEVNRYSGQMLYAEYRAPTLRNEFQTEEIRLVVKF